MIAEMVSSITMMSKVVNDMIKSEVNDVVKLDIEGQGKQTWKRIE